jgi:hypothetical protein
MKRLSLKMSLRSSGERSRLSQTISPTRCRKVCFGGSDDNSLGGDEATFAATPCFSDSKDIMRTPRRVYFERQPFSMRIVYICYDFQKRGVAVHEQALQPAAIPLASTENIDGIAT